MAGKKSGAPKVSRMGSYVARATTEETFKAFVPPPLPPDPPLDQNRFSGALARAMKALGELDALAMHVPDVSLFLLMYLRKEALLSSQIEGTQSSLADLLLYESDETPQAPIDDVEEVSNYIAALNHGLKRIKNGFPLSNRLIREMHAILLRGGRGSNKAPGEFRRSQNWIGGIRPAKAHYVPPPPELVNDLMGGLEKFVHDHNQTLPVLVKTALVHVQFESIHPFLDGNGRMGRLLITLLFCNEGILNKPVLYLSLFFKEHRRLYYELLQNVRMKGDWETWCDFFLEGVMGSAREASSDAKKIVHMLDRHRKRIAKIGRAAASARRVHAHLLKKPYLSLTKAAKELKLSVPALTSTVQKLVEIGLLKELTGRARNRIFAYHEYLVILGAGTKPLE